ncbi:type ISP restriction/modification enzyme [Rhodobacter capsulatus]|uniref:type ISP restriction/modification enzyme n=1 Tax=Rhodobacter capsulatus TaxID=1061 RepID=UPI0040262A2C
MSLLLINAYLAEIHKLKQVSGTKTEQVIREAFKDMLKAWARQQNLVFLAEQNFNTNQKTTIRPDGTILHDLRVPLGYWEAKDTADDLDTEIAKKFLKGYPQDNIIFENSETAVLFQNRAEVMRCAMTDTKELERLLTLFFGYERPEIAEFRRAVTQFQTDLPAILDALRERIDTAYKTNSGFKAAAVKFLAHAQETINPTLTEADVREMLIQHILTEEIFTQVFDGGQFHRENNIAKELFKLEEAFFTGAVKWETLKAMQPYYAAIRANAAQITSHAEKQTFLKAIYEGFYKVYNPKAADRLGVVYTPNEIVRFMIEGTDWLCQKHFGKTLIDHGVEILDPATGTGTFICELIDYFRGQPQKLHQKYKEELHANEVAILPYYVANLNIEATYAAVSGQYAEFQNLCFVDTLDNVAGLGIKSGHQHDLFAALSDENVERVRRQNKRKISVIIGNPPYNANQQNENDNNKNRAYPRIDDLIKRSFVKLSTAQKTKVYDMYSRFFRWSFDRVHDDGIIAFITNRSFIDHRTFDGFRRFVGEEFSEVYIVDLGGDWKQTGSAAGGNVFGIGTGVAISFWVKKRRQKPEKARIYYRSCLSGETAEEKLAFLAHRPLSQVSFTQVEPNSNAEWINHSENSWSSLIPIADKKQRVGGTPRTVFQLSSLGIATNRDEWVYDENLKFLENKISYFTEKFHAERVRWINDDRPDISNWVDRSIKWTSELEEHLRKGSIIPEGLSYFRKALYRPFTIRECYYAPVITHRTYRQTSIFPFIGPHKSRYIAFTDPTGQKPFMALSSDILPDLHLVGSGAGAMCVPLQRFSKNGDLVDNVTTWAFNKFVSNYGKAAKITKDDIFHYVYGVLHDPVYRETYAQNLKRELPSIPFYPDFRQWADWGQQLMALHIGYEAVDPWPITRTDTPDQKAIAAGVSPKVVLKSDPAAGTITLDSETRLSGIPPEAWEYRLGNRSALDWVLDQHKEKTPKDKTIREKFNTYRFADHKEKVADLLARVTRVSVETMQIVEAMKSATRAKTTD